MRVLDIIGDGRGQQLPYISRQDEIYANDNEVRILKLVNGEADYKSRSLTLASAPAFSRRVSWRARGPPRGA